MDNVALFDGWTSVPQSSSDKFAPLPKWRGNMRFSSFLFGLATFFIIGGPILVSRALADDRDTCIQASGEKAITACTREINSDRWRGSQSGRTPLQPRPHVQSRG